MSYGDNDGAIGYLVGEEHNGLACMFTMMNNARLEVGMQGLAIAERALPARAAYAKERVQGVARGHTEPQHDYSPSRRAPHADADARDYRGGQGAGLPGLGANRSRASRRKRQVDRARFSAASTCSSRSSRAGVPRWRRRRPTLGVQVHGGMGFIEETGAAQHMRDARILTIYEGTTGIQALDLMGRKMLRDQGQPWPN